MRHSFAIGLVATTAVLVPAGWSRLDATIGKDGKKLRPLVQSFSVDGTMVTLDVDRSLVMTGDTVSAKLVAFSDTRKKVALDLTVLQSNNYAGERVETPAIVIDRERLTIDAAPGGGKPFVTKVRLGKNAGNVAQTDSFKIFVGPHGERPPKGSEGDGDGMSAWDSIVEEGKAAAVAVKGWGGDNLKVKIEPQGPVTGDAPFLVKVTVKNTSGLKLPHQPWVSLGSQVGAYSVDSSDDVVVEPIDDDDQGDRYEKPVRKGGEIVEKFMVTPKSKALHEITLVAEVFASRDQPGPTIAGAIEVTSFGVVERTVPTVAAADTEK